MLLINSIALHFVNVCSVLIILMWVLVLLMCDFDCKLGGITPHYMLDTKIFNDMLYNWIRVERLTNHSLIYGISTNLA